MRWLFGKESRRKAFGKGLPVNDSRHLRPLDSEEEYAVAPDRRPDHEGEYDNGTQRNSKLQLESDLQRKAPAHRASGTQPDLLTFDEGTALHAQVGQLQGQLGGTFNLFSNLEPGSFRDGCQLFVQDLTVTPKIIRNTKGTAHRRQRSQDLNHLSTAKT